MFQNEREAIKKKRRRKKKKNSFAFLMFWRIKCFFFSSLHVRSIYSRSPNLRIVYILSTWTIKKKKKQQVKYFFKKLHQLSKSVTILTNLVCSICKWNEIVCQCCQIVYPQIAKHGSSTLELIKILEGNVNIHFEYMVITLFNS